MSYILDCLNNDIAISSDDSTDECIDDYFNIEEEEEEEEDILDEQKEYIVGIDLGTSNSCVSVWRNDNLEIIPDRLGNRTIPSMVSFTNCNRYIGKEAKNQRELNSGNVIYEVKRLMGKKLNDEEVQKDLPFLSYTLSEIDDRILINVDVDKQKNKYTPEEISAMILGRLKMMAEDYLKVPVNKAVITVPAYFNDGQRQATADAAAIAGLECARIINEPTAAALPYGFEKLSLQSETDINIIVYDLGGGTLDVSLLNIAEGVFEVIGSTGNSHLGGADFDHRLFSYCKSYFKKQNKISRLEDILVTSLQKLKKECEKAKKILSTSHKAIIAVKDFYDGHNLLIPITRKEFENICKDYIILCMKYIDDILNMCEMDKDDIDDIVLVGGATRMPIIRDNIKKYFHGKEPNCTVNPDEIVAAGAAMQGSILSNMKDPFSENVVLVDVTPLSLGIETIGGVMDTLIPRNTTIPIKKKRKYTTDTDYETSVNVKVYEGERKMTKDNFLVGEFELTGIDKAPRGVPEIEITFSIDVNGIISVTAEDLKNNQNKNSIIITGNKNRLTAEKIEELIKEAQKMELIDKLERDKKNMFYEIDDLCSNVRVNILNEEFKLSKKDKDIIMNDINQVMTWLEEKSYNERDKKDYGRILDSIKKKYATLILRVNNDEMNISGKSDNKNECTNIFDDDDNDIFEELENEEYGFNKDMNDEEKQEIKQLRKNLTDMCYSIYDIVNDPYFVMDEEDIDNIKNLINDTLLWVFSKEKIIKTEYIQKINEINVKCDDITKNANFEYIYTKKEELEQLCYALLSNMETKVIMLKEEDISRLYDIIEDTLQMIIEIEVEKRKAEIKGEELEMDDSVYENRLNYINQLCDELYDSKTSINRDNINIIDEDEEYDEGISIEELKRRYA